MAGIVKITVGLPVIVWFDRRTGRPVPVTRSGDEQRQEWKRGAVQRDNPASHGSWLVAFEDGARTWCFEDEMDPIVEGVTHGLHRD